MTDVAVAKAGGGAATSSSSADNNAMNGKILACPSILNFSSLKTDKFRFRGFSYLLSIVQVKNSLTSAIRTINIDTVPDPIEKKVCRAFCETNTRMASMCFGYFFAKHLHNNKTRMQLYKWFALVKKYLFLEIRKRRIYVGCQ